MISNSYFLKIGLLLLRHLRNKGNEDKKKSYEVPKGINHNFFMPCTFFFRVSRTGFVERYIK